MLVKELFPTHFKLGFLCMCRRVEKVLSQAFCTKKGTNRTGVHEQNVENRSIRGTIESPLLAKTWTRVRTRLGHEFFEDFEVRTQTPCPPKSGRPYMDRHTDAYTARARDFCQKFSEGFGHGYSESAGLWKL